jgi:hypothetical protein
MANKLKIVPVNKGGDHKTGELSGLTAAQITKILGFKPNVDDDPDKVKYSWGFTVNGKRCGIWDYHGSYITKHFSTFGPSEALIAVFGDKYRGG